MASGIDSTKHKKIYRGAFNYYRGQTIYSEETFEVFKNNKDLSLIFDSQLISRVVTGELLKINVTYHVSKDWLPTKITINKNLGQENAKELYTCDFRTNNLFYSMTSKGDREERKISTPPRFHITTPTTVTSMLFFLSKKFEQTGKNNYTIFSSNNHWTFKEELQIKNIILEKTSTSVDTVSLGGQRLKGNKFKLWEDADEGTERFMEIFLSNHAGIPYYIKDSKGVKVEIKYLNHLDVDA